MYNEDLGTLICVLLDGERARAVAETRRLIQNGVDPEQIIREAVHPAMSQLDAKCTVEQFNLLEIMLVGRAVTAVIGELYPNPETRPSTKGTVVIGALEGDVHDLGKNTVKSILAANGYRVVDCGKDCPVEKLVDAAVREHADAIAISGLITGVIPHVRKVRSEAARRGLAGIPILAGGAALKQAPASHLNTDFVAETAFDGVHYLDDCLEHAK